MARKEKTPAEKKAWGQKMKAAREAKAKLDTVLSAEAAGAINPESHVPEMTTPSEPSVAELMKRIQELEQRQFFQQPIPQQSQGAQVTSQGVVGTTTKYDDPKSYPDPRDRLFGEPKLTIQGFTRDWWDLVWTVTAFRYQTKDGLWFSEPKFDLELIRIVADDEGMPSSKRYVLHKLTLFEDPDAAMQVANQYGVEVPDHLEKSFLDEMRYLRVRDWVLESFYPPKPTQERMNKTETVIGNRLVEVFEANSATPVEVPFKQLNKKL
jgi:hypothetical protein